MSSTLKPYSLEDLTAAVADYNHAKGQHKELFNQLKAKRDAITSLENDEVAQLQIVERHASKVRTIAKSLG